MMKIENASVFVSTYHKYNCGDIIGKWLKLANYPTKSEFIKACNKLHADEYDPEFMYQDYEEMPNIYYSESYINEEVFEVIQKVMSLTPERRTEYYKWCEDNEYLQDLTTITEFIDKNIIYINVKPTALNEVKEILAKKGYSNAYGYAVKLADKYVVFPKVDLETEFLFGYSDFGQGLTYYEANKLAKLAKTDTKRFIYVNINNFHQTIALQDIDNFKLIKLHENIYIPYYGWNDAYEPTEAERKAILIAKVEYGKLFKRRINSYLDRYGLTKVKSRVYWVDE